MNLNYTELIPILSTDLHFNKLSEKEYILSNLSNKHYLKISKQVFDLLQLIDGNKNLKSLTLEYNSQNNLNYNVKGIYILLYQKLISYGILQGFESQIKETEEKPSYLNLSFIIFNEELVAKISKYFYFLFKKNTAIFLILFSLGLLSFSIFFHFDLYKSFNLSKSFIYFIVVMIFSTTFHEFGHASAASFFGAKHGGIGGGFYLFSPVYFADVTDIWRLKKHQRIIVNLSGVYFELIFGSILILFSLITKNYNLLLISVFICVKTFFNLLPFLRTDGFWILSDLIDKPNLFKHSTQKIKDIFNFIFKKEALNFSKIDVFLLFYGLFNYALILKFLYFVLIKNPKSILYFPQNLYAFVFECLNNSSQISFQKISQIIIPFIFFILLFKTSKKLIKSFFELLKKI